MPQPIHVLYLPVHAASIFFRGYAAEPEGFTLIAWTLERLSRRVAPGSLVIVCHDGLDVELAEAAARPFGIPVLASAAGTRLGALADLAQGFAGREFIVFFPEAAFAPAGILRAMWEHHLREGNQYTYAPDLPYGVSPEIFHGPLLAALAQVAFDGPAPDLSAAVHSLIERRRQGPVEDRICAVPCATGCCFAGPVPKSLLIESILHSRAAKRCLADLPSDYTSEPLDRWTAAEPDYPPPQWSSTQPDVLFVSGWAGYSGAEECLRLLADGLGRLGWKRAALAGVDDLLARRLREGGTDVFCANWQFEADTPLARRFAAEALESLHPAIIHANSNPGPGLIEAAARRGIPVVTHVRTVDFSGYGAALAASRHLLAVSDYVKRQLIASGVAAEKISTIYDGVDTDHFRPQVFDSAAMKQEFGFEPDILLMVMIARIVPGKRHDVALRALARAKAAAPQLRMAFVGGYSDPACRSALATLERELELGDAVRWLPFQPDIRRIECAADAVVLCSEREALGTCVLEAMALAKPVILADGSGMVEAIEPEVSGIAVRAGDAASLAEAMLRLSGDPAARTALGRAARARAMDRFTVLEQARSAAAAFERCCR